jgi:hypothetical protein
MASPCSGETLPPAKRPSSHPAEVASVASCFEKPWKHLDMAWWTRKHPHWKWAVEKFTAANGLEPSFANVLASILMPKPLPNDNHLARKQVYRKLAKWAGYTERQPLPDYVLSAVR